MGTELDHHDIQGNILKGYARLGYPMARYVFYRIRNKTAGRKFVAALHPLVTSGVPWARSGNPEEFPAATTNLAFTFRGLEMLGVPQKSLSSFPQEFVMGMKARWEILGDDGVSAPSNWDPIWQAEEPVHIWLSINGLGVDGRQAIERRYQAICDILQGIVTDYPDGVEQLRGHRDADGKTAVYQEASALFENGKPIPREHFGYVDGISDPYFEGCDRRPEKVLGMGKPTGHDPRTLEGWAPLETGEFILGYKDEAYEYPLAPLPRLLSFNGTFMVYRKLHENVGSFNAYLDDVGKRLPDGPEQLAAKFAGRWRNGAPLTTFRTKAEADEFAARVAQARANNSPELPQLLAQLVAFDYNDDLAGAGCPVGAHVRRANPRGALAFGKPEAYQAPGALVNRRRIGRRGLPYGEVSNPTRDDGNHGIIFMAINASIERQFEFVQQQWMNYGNDFKLGSSKDALIGNHGDPARGELSGHAIFEADPDGDSAPFFCGGIRRFVETRGGDYFFLPSLTALRMMSEGIVDPT